MASVAKIGVFDSLPMLLMEHWKAPMVSGWVRRVPDAVAYQLAKGGDLWMVCMPSTRLERVQIVFAQASVI